MVSTPTEGGNGNCWWRCHSGDTHLLARWWALRGSPGTFFCKRTRRKVAVNIGRGKTKASRPGNLDPSRQSAQTGSAWSGRTPKPEGIPNCRPCGRTARTPAFTCEQSGGKKIEMDNISDPRVPNAKRRRWVVQRCAAPGPCTESSAVDAVRNLSSGYNDCNCQNFGVAVQSSRARRH